MIQTIKTVHIQVGNKLIPLGTAKITICETFGRPYDITLDDIKINVKKGEQLFNNTN